MSNINKVILIGRLGKDPEVRYLENGAAVAKMGVATTESYKDKQGEWQDITEWHDVIMWRFLAERAEKSLKKGALVYIEGKLKSRKYQKEGEDTARKITEVVADTFRLLSKREGGGFENTFPSQDDEMLHAKSSNLSGGNTDVNSGGKTEQTPATPPPANTNPVANNNVSSEEPADDLPF